MTKIISLVQMEIGQTGKIVEIHGKQGTISKMGMLGIRIGEEIKKAHQQFMKGPVVVEIGKSEVAIGFGMAQKVFVEEL